MAEWRNKQTLEQLYINDGLSMAECADKLGCSRQTIKNWLDKHDIPTRSKTDHLTNTYATHYYDDRGYECSRSFNDYIRLHRLIAIAEGYDPHDIFSGLNVHHKNEIPWDNRPSNLEVMEHGQHRELHEGTLGAPWKSKDVLVHYYHGKGMSLAELSEEFGVSHSTIAKWMEKYDIPRRKAWAHSQR